jgi:hypothetical protein
MTRSGWWKKPVRMTRRGSDAPVTNGVRRMNAMREALRVRDEAVSARRGLMKSGTARRNATSGRMTGGAQAHERDACLLEAEERARERHARVPCVWGAHP